MDGSDGSAGSRADRRGFLGLLGVAALAGCSRRQGAESGSDSTLTPVPLPDSTATPRDGKVASQDRVDARALEAPWQERTAVTTLSPAGLTVAFHPRPTAVPELFGGGDFGRPGTAEDPARLDLWVLNRGEEAVSVQYGPVTGRLVTPQGDARAFLVPPRAPEADEDEDEGSQRDRFRFDGYWRGRPRSGRDRTLRIEPGEPETLEYLLVAEPEGPAIPVGTYVFETAFDWTFTLGVWRTDAPGPETTSRLAGTDVPGLPADGPTEWFHEADRTTAVYLRPSAERVSLAGGPATLCVALFNHSSTALVGNPLAYELLKLHEGSWYHVVPEQLPAPGGNLPPGATLEKRFDLRHGSPTDRDDAVPVGHLGGGRYAVRFGMHRPGDPRQYAALLDADAPELALSPSPELRVAGRDSARETAWLHPDDRLFDAFVAATRTDEPADRALVAEQVMHEPVLRNTLSLFEPGVETVELYTRDHVADRLLRPGETLRVSLRGTIYELARRDD